MSTTMAPAITSLGSPPPLAPPSIPLPPLPVGKTRRASPDTPTPTTSARSAKQTTQTPARIATRSVTTSAIPTSRPAKATSTPSVPTLSTAWASPPPLHSLSPSRPPSLRKTVSIEAFPQPPKGSRLSSLPPSPLSASLTADTLASPDTAQGRPALSPRTSSLRRPTPRTSGYGLRHKSSATSLTSPAESRPFHSSIRHSESLLSLPSPSTSRTSSARDSIATEATATDAEEEPLAIKRHKSSDDVSQSPTEKDGKGNIIVSVRVRPDAGDAAAGASAKADGEWMVDGRRALVSYNGREGGDHFYDNVYSAHDNNARVYDSAAKRLVRRVMEGYNGTVFAYGMTGTGKTFSMQGTAVSPGVIPLAITDIFSYIRENPMREFLLRVSYLEIYNERIFDLLSPVSGQQQDDIKLREDGKGRVYATPLKEEIVQSPNQLLRVIARGDQARKVAGTQFNARSSRSHAVVQIVVESRGRSATPGAESRRSGLLPGGVLVSTLSLIDLAGSEKAAEDKERRTEGGHINKSLLTLGTVIARISGDDKDAKGKASAAKDPKHLPYRDSKLTRLLQPALSGTSLVSILCTIQLSTAASTSAAAMSHTAETLNTLKFASRAKNNLVSHAKRNVSDTANSADPGSRALLDRYKLEIAALKQQLEEQNRQQDKVKEEIDREEEEALWRERVRESAARHEEQMLEMQLARTALKERIGHLNRLILSSKSLGVNSARFSTNSSAIPSVNRTSTSSAVELANLKRNSAASTGALTQPEYTRSLSASSATMGMLPAASTSQAILASASDDGSDASVDVDDNASESVTGKASSGRRIRALQADLADKNRYIATLEKRLLQVKRSSNNNARSGLGLSPQSANGERNGDNLMREKDQQIEDLKARVDDLNRMVNALRSAARKRDLLDGSGFGQHPAYRRDSADSVSTIAAGSAHRSPSRPTTANSSTATRLSCASQKSEGSLERVKNFSRPAPVSLSTDETSNGISNSGTRNSPSKEAQSNRRSVEEVTKLLGGMLRNKANSGDLSRGNIESVGTKRDTVIERNEKEQGQAPTTD